MEYAVIGSRPTGCYVNYQNNTIIKDGGSLFFFLIGKKNFIKKSQCVHKICTKRPNSYKIEGEAETEFKEAIKSATQLAVEKPHTLDQSNKELANFSRI